VTPYRTARVEGSIADPSRPKFGLAGAAVGAIACFIALADQPFHRWTHVHDMLLFGGSAAIALLVAYSTIEAPAGRVFTLLAVGVYTFSFIPQIIVHSWMGSWVWSVRYFGLAGIAGGLLLRLRRTRPGSYGALLRCAALVAAWWASTQFLGTIFENARQAALAETCSRIVYLLLAAGMLDVRRYVGAVPMRETERTPLHAAREIATTRVGLALVSILAGATTLDYAWNSEWAVIAAAETVSIVVTLAFHAPWLARNRSSVIASVATLASIVAAAFVFRAFDHQSRALRAVLVCAVAAATVDFAILRFAATDGDEARAPSVLAASALILHAIAFAVVAARISP